MFAMYKGNVYLFARNSRLVTEKACKASCDFERKVKPAYYYKDIDINNPDVTDIFDVELWLEHDTGYDGFPTEWYYGLSGDAVADGKLVIYASVCVPGWKRTGKSESDGFIDPANIKRYWVLYKFAKKDGVLLDEPMTIREDVSLEEFLKLRHVYGKGNQ